MRDVLLVGGGSFIGGVSRYYLGGWILHNFGTNRFPLSTLIVNLVGCLLIGVLASIAEHQHLLSQSTRLFLLTGLLGGFTTFSAFSYETFYLMRTDGFILAVLNVLLSVALCLAATWAGFRVTQAL